MDIAANIEDRNSSFEVLLVEDNPADAELVREYLWGSSEPRWLVRHSWQLSEALSQVRDYAPDLLVIDLGLPDAKGLESLNALRAAQPTKPIVVLTGHDDAYLGHQAVAAGAQDYLSKDDITPHLLKRTMLYAMERSSWLSQLSAVVANNSDAIVVVNSEGVVQFVNPAAEKLFRQPRDLFLGTNFGHPLEPGTTRELEFITEQGKSFAEMRVAPIEWEGEPAFVASLRDINDRKQASLLEQKLWHADRLSAVGRLAAGVAHEVNNPAAFILGNIEMLEEDLAEIRSAMHLDSSWPHSPLAQRYPEMQSMLKDCKDGIQRISKLVQDLRTFSRLKTDGGELVNINELIEAACRMTSNEIRHRAQLTKKLSPVPAFVGDRSKLLQVITNLLVNAAHSIESGQAANNSIEVISHYQDSMLTISVKDTGCGIPEEQQTQIFEPFYTTKKREVGTGLGLSLSAEIIAKHHGEIRVSSKLGQGSCFELVFDLSKLPKSLEKTNEDSLRTPGDLKRYRILVIEDEVQLLNVYRRRLGRQHQVVVAEDGPQALQILRQDQAFDAIICDVMMPNMDGAEVFEAIQQCAPQLASKVIFCTSGAFTPRAQLFLEEVSNPRLEKPIDQQQMYYWIQQVAQEKTTSH